MANFAFYVEDAVGDTFLHTIAPQAYERSFREHARWWMTHIRSARSHDGKAIRRPLRPIKIVVEELPA